MSQKSLDDPPDHKFSNDSDSEDMNRLPPLPESGLPHDADPDHVPGLAHLQRVAMTALDDATFFVITNQGNSTVIAERLEDLAELVMAAIGARGDDSRRAGYEDGLRKAVRLGLELDLKYWLRANKLAEWMDMIGPLLTTAIQIREFQAEVYRLWSIYRYVEGQIPGAKKVLEASREYAAESGREDLELLAQSDRFNYDVFNLNVEEAEAQAAVLIDAAKRLGYDYVHGRVHISLARVFDKASLHRKTFENAQQALAILMQTDEVELTGEAITFMLGVLGHKKDQSPAYRAAVLEYLKEIVDRSAHPIFQAAVYFFQGQSQYYQGEYDSALRMLLAAWRKYRQSYYPISVNRTLHMLGMVQTKRQRWSAAEFYLREARERYEAIDEKVNGIHALHAWAFIPYEQEDWEQTLARLETTLHAAEKLGDQVPQRLIDGIQADIKDVEEKCCG